MVYLKGKMSPVGRILAILAAIVLCCSALCLVGCAGSADPSNGGTGFDIKVSIAGNGYDKETSTKAIAYVKRVSNESGEAVDGETGGEYMLFYLNEESAIKVAAAGTYSLEFVSPINADGSIYEMPNTQTIEASTTGTISYEGRATLIAASDVGAERLQKVVDTINAIYNKVDDKNVRKELKSMLSLMKKNVESSPNADAVVTENTGSTDAAERIENGNNAGGSAGYASDQDGNSCGSSTSGASESGYSGNGADSSGSGSYSGGSESGSGSYAEPDPTPDVHVHNWEYATDYEYVRTDWVCDKCGVHVSDVGSHVCSGQGCTFHQETIYNELPYRYCLGCGAIEYL